MPVYFLLGTTTLVIFMQKQKSQASGTKVTLQNKCRHAKSRKEEKKERCT